MIRRIALLAMLCTSALSAAETLDAANLNVGLAAAQHVLSADHMNLIRVAGEKILDAVIPKEALEIEPDKARGILYVRLRPAWVKLHHEEDVSIYLSTAKGTYSVTLSPRTVPAQTIVISPKTGFATSEENSEDTHVSTLTRPLAPMAEASYPAELKALVRYALKRGTKRVPEEPFKAKGAEKIVPVPVQANVAHFKSFTVRETAAYLTSDKALEVLAFENKTLFPQKLDIGELAKAIPGTLALALTKKEADLGEALTVVLVRARSEASRGKTFQSACLALARKAFGRNQ